MGTYRVTITRRPGVIRPLLLGTGFLLVAPLALLYLAGKHGYPPVRRFYSHPDPETRRKRRLNTAVVLAALFTLSTFTSLAQLHVADAGAAVVAAGLSGWWASREYRIPLQARARELAARADAQHQQVMTGDPAGVFGTNP
jgi:hypothetical protein